MRAVRIKRAVLHLNGSDLRASLVWCRNDMRLAKLKRSLSRSHRAFVMLLVLLGHTIF